jgi:hypothetical protein
MVVHVSSSENTSYPLCRASRFAQVTPCVENVTCAACLAMLDRGTPEALGAHAAIGRAKS